MHTFLWHDYETFGNIARRDRPAQFAAIRTDHELNVIGRPINVFCKPTPDVVPSLEACLVTGITPQIAMEKGIPEHSFAKLVVAELGMSDTIGVGYNTIKFDDEITRFMLWRNLIEPYGREWQNGCGRWDIIEMVRVMYAFRPDGIHWPENEKGSVVVKLDRLAPANGLIHESAHDALSDVQATIDLARLIRKLQPKLFDACFALHKKEAVQEQIGLGQGRPFLHVSSLYPEENGRIAILQAISLDAKNNKEIICWDLSKDPTMLLDATAEELRTNLFKKSVDMTEDEERTPLKKIAINKSPMVFKSVTGLLTPALQSKWHIDVDAANRNMEKLAALKLKRNIVSLVQDVYSRSFDGQMDPDEDLYGGFLSNTDRRSLDSFARISADKMASPGITFQDSRLVELVFRYRARNFPETLTVEEASNWREHVARRIVDGHDGHRTIKEALSNIDQKLPDLGPRDKEIATALREYLVELEVKYASVTIS